MPLMALAKLLGLIFFIALLIKEVRSLASRFQLKLFVNPATKSNVLVMLFPMNVPVLSHPKE